MDREEISEWREYAWKYFSLHAEQRLKTFHFFVVLSTVISGAILTIIKDMSNAAYAAPMCYLLSFLAFIFWKLDQRNRELIKHGESALQSLEKDTMASVPEPASVHLFVSEEGKTNAKKRFPKAPLMSAHFSYTNCFNWVFFVFGVGGFFLGCFLLVSNHA
jgi:hypothetical protein